MKSGTFRMSRTRCYLLMMLHQAQWLFWLLCIVTVGLVTLGFIYSPWHGVAAIGFSSFIIMMGLSFLIFAFGFNSITGMNLAEHSIETSPAHVRVLFEDGKTVEIDRERILRYKIYPGGVLIPVTGPQEGWLWIPVKAFENPADLNPFLKEVYRKEHESNTE